MAGPSVAPPLLVEVMVSSGLQERLTMVAPPTAGR